MGWHSGKKGKATSAPWILGPITEWVRYQTSPSRTAIIDNEYRAPAGGVSYHRAASYSKNLPSHQGVDMCCLPDCDRAQTPTLTQWHAYLQHWSALSNSPLSLEIQQLSGSVEYTDPPNASAPIPVSAPATCKEGTGEVPAGAWYTEGSSRIIHLPGWQLPSNHSLTLSGWKRGKNYSNHWAELRAVWLAVMHELWPLILYTDNWTVLKRVGFMDCTMEMEGWIIMNKTLWRQEMWKDNVGLLTRAWGRSYRPCPRS